MTDESINVQIATELGWTEIEPHSWWIEDEWDTYEKHGFRGIAPGDHSRSPVPDFLHSLDAVVAVLPTDFDVVILRQIGGGYCALIRRDLPDTHLQEWRAYSDTRWEAPAKALLEWAKWMKTQVEP